jgi:hypothetical protein
LWIANRELHGEAVELGFGQRVGAVMLDGVLRGDDEERRAEGMLDVVHGDLPLGHRLQQGALRAGGGAVDFVGQQHIGKDWAGQKLKLAGLLVEDAKAGDVAGQQVRGTLHAGEAATDGGGQRLGQRGLAQPRQVLQQQVPPGQQAPQDALDHLGLAANRPVQRRPQPGQLRPMLLRHGRRRRCCRCPRLRRAGWLGRGHRLDRLGRLGRHRLIRFAHALALRDSPIG